MKKKILAVALAATMVVGSAFSAFAAKTEETVATDVTLAVDSYTEMDNPLQGKVEDSVTLTYTITWNEGAAQNGWDGIFSFYDEASGGRVSIQTAPYVCYNDGQGNYMDVKSDAWCSSNCVVGTAYTFVITITADGITATCDGVAVDNFGADDGTNYGNSGEATYQDILDAINTYPTLTVGVGQGISSYWYTEISTVSITVSTGTDDGTTTDDGNTTDDSSNTTDDSSNTTDDSSNTTDNSSNTTTDDSSSSNSGTSTTTETNTETADVSTFATVAVVLAAAVAIVALRKRVTE